MMVASGASVDLIDERTFRELYKRKVIEASKRRIFSYGSSTPLPVLGTIEAEIFANANSTWTTLYVIKGASGNLLGFNTATKLGVLKVINQVKPDETGPQFPINGDLESLFGGIGKVKGKVIKLHMDPDVIPTQQPHRRIPFHVRKDVEMELKRLEELEDIIENVTGPTPLVSPLVIVPKSSGQVRICVDIKAVKRVKHSMPTMGDLVADLNGATVFSKLDLSSGYHQLELAPESRYITTFSPHVELRRYKRLMFGISAASEIFQSVIEEILKNIFNDIKNGVKADPAKIKSIIDMSRPESVSEWADEQQRAFYKLKDSLTKNHVVSYINPRLKTEVTIDASPVGLGGLLVQDSKVISYARRALSEVESRYSQTEREMLGVVWAVEHFYPSKIDSEERNIAEDYVNYVCNQVVPKAITLQEIKLESEKDISLQALIKAIETDQWTRPEVQDYRNVKDELLVYQGTVLRGNRIVVPKALRDSCGPSSRWAPRNSKNKTPHQRKGLVSWCRQDGSGESRQQFSIKA
ncbi:Uncharacterized protein K02A2.6 [Stylophora pistillata]|uniref:Uncharacterized protein K02A2.6 n=1 Tax=Stylophora pistillata TaxID=50429 RepID=A0A2B4SIU8_STYPI|nr:Uncharacterized protein K02A2.6 [Stylophora pistillata]